MPRRRRSRGRRAPRPAPTHCYHWSGDNEIRSMDFQIGSNLSREILKDFQFGSIGSLKRFQKAMSRRDTDAVTYAKSPNFPSYSRVYGRNKTFDMEERKTFISSGCNHLWQEKLYGITRVAVYGVDSVCVVTRNKDLVQLKKDYARLSGTTYTMLDTPWNSLISEVEDLACPPGESRQTDRSQKPFGIVSVVEGLNKVHKVSGHEASSNKFDEPKAIEFLREEMNGASTFTFRKTVKTAICALQHLFHKKFKPKEIRVFVWKRARKSHHHLYACDDDTLKELKIRDERSINDILAVINKRHIAGALVSKGGSP